MYLFNQVSTWLNKVRPQLFKRRRRENKKKKGKKIILGLYIVNGHKVVGRTSFVHDVSL